MTVPISHKYRYTIFKMYSSIIRQVKQFIADFILNVEYTEYAYVLITNQQFYFTFHTTPTDRKEREREGGERERRGGHDSSKLMQHSCTPLLL
jgi:hypothetical protein